MGEKTESSSFFDESGILLAHNISFILTKEKREEKRRKKTRKKRRKKEKKNKKEKIDKERKKMKTAGG